jgi:mannose-6-phosphate isomerase-like protein (cupin superfamily)
VKKLLLVRESLNSFLNESEGSSKKGFFANIEKETLDNKNYRKVLYTGTNLQLVLMSLKPNEEVGEEIHEDNDQFFRFEGGNGKVLVNDTEYEVGDGDSVIIPAGSLHNIINTGTKELKMYTIYAPPHHKNDTLFANKDEAEEMGEDFNGQTSE